MWGKYYVVTPRGIMVPPESAIEKPEQLAGREISVGYPQAAIVFLPYTEAMYAKTQAWIQERGLFEGQAAAVDYAACVAA